MADIDSRLTRTILAAVCFLAGCGGGEAGTATNAGAGGLGHANDGGGGAGGTPQSDAANDSMIALDGSATGGSGHADAAPDTTCGAIGATVEAIPPDMLIVFDRSCSMRRFHDTSEAVFGSGPDDPRTRWNMATTALDSIMTQYDARVRFGLMVFPRMYEGCGDTPEVDVMPAVSNRTKILDRLQQVHPFDVCQSGEQPHETPTERAILAVSHSGVFSPSAHDAYVLLMTDGMATCGATASSLAQVVGTLYASSVKTAVVGFGDADSSDAVDMLESMGQAGGVMTSSPWYWFAEDPASLTAAIGTIIKSTVSCTFKLGNTPPAPDKIYAYFDGQQVPQDPVNGWSYDPSTETVTFHGASCNSLQDGAVKNVSIVFGCPDPSCVPSPEVCDGFDNDCDGEVDETSCVQ